MFVNKGSLVSVVLCTSCTPCREYTVVPRNMTDSKYFLRSSSIYCSRYQWLIYDCHTICFIILYGIKQLNTLSKKTFLKYSLTVMFLGTPCKSYIFVLFLWIKPKNFVIGSKLIYIYISDLLNTNQLQMQQPQWYYRVFQNKHGNSVTNST